MKTIKEIEEEILRLENDLEEVLATNQFVLAKDIYTQIRILKWVNSE